MGGLLYLAVLIVFGIFLGKALDGVFGFPLSRWKSNGSLRPRQPWEKRQWR